MSTYSNAKIIFGLNTLTKVNRKRIKYYRQALERSDDVDLILWFNRYATHLQKANDVLSAWLQSYGAQPAPADNSGEIVSHWDQIKDLFILSRRNSLLEHCELLERNALKVFTTAVALNFVPSVALSDVDDQIEDIRQALESLRLLKNNQSHELQVA